MYYCMLILVNKVVFNDFFCSHEFMECALPTGPIALYTGQFSFGAFHLYASIAYKQYILCLTIHYRIVFKIWHFHYFSVWGFFFFFIWHNYALMIITCISQLSISML